MLDNLLKEAQYDNQERAFLVNGFSEGFDIEYRGPTNRRDTAVNLPFREVGNIELLWEKVMNKVKLGRYAGPYDNPPFENYVQSPIGRVPKSGGRTRLIFHLSYCFKSGFKSINHYTPKELCSVKYDDVDHTVGNSLKWRSLTETKKLYYAKLDLVSAFRIAPVKRKCYPWLIMYAVDPSTMKKQFFIEKNLSFGHSISCSHFQRFSRALKHLVEYFSGKPHSGMIYLDDYLFIAPSRQECDYLVSIFCNLCRKIGVPIAHEKTLSATTHLTFLGIGLDGERLLLTVPDDKRIETQNRIQYILSKRKATVKEMESLAGLLNFREK